MLSASSNRPSASWPVAVVILHWISGLAFYISIGVFWRHPIALTIWLTGVSAAVFLLLWRKELRAIFLVGVILGTIGEVIFTATRIRMWYYHPEGLVFGLAIPLWLPLLWGYTATLINQMGIWLSGRMSVPPTKLKTIQILFLTALTGYFVLLYYKILLGILIAYAVGLLLIQIWRPDWQLVVVFTTACLIGPLGESFGIHLGIWRYMTTNFRFLVGGTEMNISYSLPLAWGLATVMISQLAASLLRKSGTLHSR